MRKVNTKTVTIIVACVIGVLLLAGRIALQDPRFRPREDHGFTLYFGSRMIEVERHHYEQTGTYLDRRALECAMDRTLMERAIRARYLAELTVSRNSLVLTICSGINPWCRVFPMEGSRIVGDTVPAIQRHTVSGDLTPVERCREGPR